MVTSYELCVVCASLPHGLELQLGPTPVGFVSLPWKEAWFKWRFGMLWKVLSNWNYCQSCWYASFLVIMTACLGSSHVVWKQSSADFGYRR